MSFAQVHDFFESNCPAGAGFALQSGVIADAIKTLIGTFSSDPSRYQDIPLDRGRVRFSFTIDPAKFNFTSRFEVSLQIRVWLHPAGDPSQEIVTLLYDVDHVPISATFDGNVAEFVWTTASNKSATLLSEQWNPSDAPLLAAGYVAGDGSADRQLFKEEIYFGFVWVNARNLLPAILRSIPFPQVQVWFLAFRLQPPFQTKVEGGYIHVWTEQIIDVGHTCGISEIPSTAPGPNWKASAGTPGSPIDADEPPVAVYLAAINLARWQANGLAPAVMLSGSGGGFIRYSYDAAVSLQSFELTLHPGPAGGTLSLDAKLRALGLASAWIDGPSGSRLSLISLGITADGDLRGSATATFNVSRARIDIEAHLRASIDQRSVQIEGGGLWPLTVIIAEVAELLARNGAFKLTKSFSHQSSIELFDVSSIAASEHSDVVQRVGRSSTLVAFIPRVGIL